MLWAFSGALVVTVFGGGIAIALMRDLTKLEDLEKDFNERVTLVYQYSDGLQMRVEGDRPGPLIDIETLPDYVVYAVLAAEDHEFYSHDGVRWGSILRAAWDNVEAGAITSGASTITQQLVKNTYDDDEQSYARKIREIVVAQHAEDHFRKLYGVTGGKNQILSLYMSRIELGFANGLPVLGFEDAALRYYGVPARELTMGQAALLAGMLNSWTRLNPRKNYLAARQRRDLILDRMHRFGFITETEMQAAMAETNTPVDDEDRSYLYALDSVRPEAIELAKQVEGGDDLLIRTSIERDLQRTVARVVSEELRGYPSLSAAVIVATGEGRIRALVGGRDYGQVQFNAARDGNVGLGSLLKPFVFLEAISQGADPASRCLDEPLPAEMNWPLRNSNRRFVGPMSLEDALAISNNVVAARLVEEVGRDRMINQLGRLGFGADSIPDSDAWLISANGSPMQVLKAFLPLANGGRIVTPTLTDAVRTEKGAIISQRDEAFELMGYDSADLATLQGMLRGAVTYGTGQTAGDLAGIEIAGKTATESQNRSAWFVGFGEYWVATVWVGHEGDGAGPSVVAGGNLPARIFGRIVRESGASWMRPGRFLEPLADNFRSENANVVADAPTEAASQKIFSTGRARPGYGCVS